MARLSVNDLNNLSGISNNELNKLYDIYREAHTKLFNDINNWVVKYETISSKLDEIAGTTYENDCKVYKVARELYWSGGIILDNVDLFDDYTKSYKEFLSCLRCNTKNITELVLLLMSSKKKILDRLSQCYGLYSEAYKRLYEEE